MSEHKNTSESSHANCDQKHWNVPLTSSTITNQVLGDILDVIGLSFGETQYLRNKCALSMAADSIDIRCLLQTWYRTMSNLADVAVNVMEELDTSLAQRPQRPSQVPVHLILLLCQCA